MNWYEMIKRYYKLGFYDEEKLNLFVKAKKITADQKEEIIKGV